MKINHIAWLIGASALAILALIGIQVNWMRQSRQLIEEQFNNRVNMALCSTVEKMAESQTCSEELRTCCAQSNDSVCGQTFDNLLDNPEMSALLTNALHFYQIDLPYRVLITPKDSGVATASVPFACSLNPILQDDTHLLQLEFQGKTDYYLQRMGFMVSASVVILLFICLIFGLATLYLIRQKRMSDRNRDFFNHMTHEFRTPLTNIRLAGSLMAKKHKELAGNQYLGIIRRECDQLTRQVENVLYLAGLEKGDYPLHKEPVNLNQLTRDVISGLELQIQERNARIHLDPAAPACTVDGDVFHLGNAFRNILDNALKYSKGSPEISIGFHPDDSGCRVSFVDNGIGLPSRERRNIFRKFHRCAGAIDSGEKGFGLGLAYVKKIVDMHRGQVVVNSESGKGTRFELFFPV